MSILINITALCCHNSLDSTFMPIHQYFHYLMHYLITIILGIIAVITIILGIITTITIILGIYHHHYNYRKYLSPPLQLS